MKKITTITIAIACFLIGNQVGNYSAAKDYEAACLFSDIIRCAMDDNSIGTEMQELYDDWTQGIDTGDLELRYLKEEDLDSYVWCY